MHLNRSSETFLQRFIATFCNADILSVGTGDGIHLEKSISRSADHAGQSVTAAGCPERGQLKMSFPHFLPEMKKGTAPSGGVRQSTTGQIDLSISSFSKILENAPSEFRQGKPHKFLHLSDGIRRKLFPRNGRKDIVSINTL